MNMKITLDDGKYEIEEVRPGVLDFRRHGERWEGAYQKYTGSKLVYSMVCRIAELEAARAAQPLQQAEPPEDEHEYHCNLRFPACQDPCDCKLSKK